MIKGVAFEQRAREVAMSNDVASRGFGLAERALNAFERFAAAVEKIGDAAMLMAKTAAARGTTRSRGSKKIVESGPAPQLERPPTDMEREDARRRMSRLGSERR